MSGAMEVQFVYAAVRVRELDAATAYYANLFGRAPDDRPMESLVQWRMSDKAGAQLFADADRAGHGILTLVVRDMAREQARLAALGIDIGEVREGSFGRIARFADPDGNTVVLAEPPGRQ